MKVATIVMAAAGLFALVPAANALNPQPEPPSYLRVHRGTIQMVNPAAGAARSKAGARIRIPAAKPFRFR